MIDQPNSDRTVPVELEHEMRQAYLDYAMSVIVSRALPDVRDGLKPVQRRILYTMHEMGLRNDRPFRKSAAIVGEVMGKYHPHGDAPIYDALVRLAQDFAARYPTVQGQGNFGCFSGDTKVEMYQGEPKTLAELVDMAHRGMRAEVFTVDSHRNVRIKPMRAPRLVRRGDTVVKVTLESGAEIVCTPDHRFMLRDGTYREAEKLKAKDQLMPFARTAIPERLHRTGAFPIPASLTQKVAKVEPAGKTDVYDLTVDVTQNFALAVGVFAHNSIDDDPPAAMRYCVTGDTLVRTTAATERIGELGRDTAPDSDHDLDLELLDRAGRPARASKLFHSGTHPTLRLRTREGYELTGTVNHPVLVIQPVAGVPMLTWKLLEEIGPGDRVAMLRTSAPVETTPLLPRDLALATLAGGMVSEGWASEKRAGFNNLDPDYFAAVKTAYDEIVGGRSYAYSRTIKSKSVIQELDVPNLTALRGSPLAEMIGLRSAQKCVPTFVWSSSPAFKRAFLQALFEGDGSSSILGPESHRAIQVSYSTRSQRLASEVQQLLLEFGVVCKQCHYHDGEIKLVISNRRDARRFAAAVGFHGAKQGKLEAELAQIPLTSSAMSADSVPFIAEYIRGERMARWTDREWLRKHNIDRIERWERDGDAIRAHLTNDEVRRVVEPLVDGTYYYATVDIVEDAGAQPVYSLRVETDDHSFITNGFVSHNTEARLAAVANELLADIDKDTVDWAPNYDHKMQQPVVLPGRLPNLIVNGSVGIAVGMATNIPPHNLREVVEATKRLIEDPELTNDDICQTMKGPDFPGGATIYRFEEERNVETGKAQRVDGISRAYATGRGRIVMRAKAHTEEMRGNREAIIVSQLPYAVNKASLIEKIADLVQNKRLAGISDIRDESDRDGMRVVIEVKRDDSANRVLNNLFKHTAMQSSFNMNMLALVDNQPRVLSLKEVLQHHIEYRKDVIRRRTEFDLQKAKDRAHILEGLKIAHANLDAIIKLIRAHKAQEQLLIGKMREQFGLSEIQAKAILDMQLRRLSALEREKLDEEYEAVIKLISELESILGSARKILSLIKADLDALSEKYGDERRTEIIDDLPGQFTDEQLVSDEDVVITLSSRNYAKRMPLSTYRQQHRGGRGVIGMQTRDEDDVEHLVVARNHDRLYVFTDRGRVFALKAYELPDASRTAKGTPIQNILEAMQPGERVSALVALRDTTSSEFLVMATRKGFIKKTPLSEYANVRRAGLIAIALRKGDVLAWVAPAHKDDRILLATKKGKGITFKATDARPMGRPTQGVTGIRLGKGDEVVGMGIVRPRTEVLSVTANGYGKRTGVDEFPTQGRGGQGVILASLGTKTGDVAAVQIVDEGSQEILLISSNGVVIRTPLDQIRVLGRPTMGVKVMTVGDAKIASIATFTSTRPTQTQLPVR